jgi:hypothetical protein
MCRALGYGENIENNKHYRDGKRQYHVFIGMCHYVSPFCRNFTVCYTCLVLMEQNLCQCGSIIAGFIISISYGKSITEIMVIP